MAKKATVLTEGIRKAFTYSSQYDEESDGDIAVPATDFYSLAARSILRRILSVKHVVSISSSYTESDSSSNERQQFTCIGRGSCGTIWNQPVSEIVFKTSPDQRALWADFHQTNKVHNSFIRYKELMESTFPDVIVPRVSKASRFFTSSNKWWETALEKFPSGGMPNPDSTAIQFGLIPPILSKAREALIHLYFDPAYHEKALADPENKDCLVRLYFGTNRGSVDTWPTSLRNFELYLDMAQDLGLDVETITQEMAISLALMHWDAKCDGMDAEWVLGSAAREEVLGYSDPNFLTKEATDLEPHFKRTTNLWILDFDKSRPIEYDETCIPLLLGGVTANDPYLPNPKRSPKRLYQLLAETYLVASQIILRREDPREEVLELPRLFLNAWEAWAEEPEDLGFDLEGWDCDDSNTWDEDEYDEEEEEDDNDDSDSSHNEDENGNDE